MLARNGKHPPHRNGNSYNPTSRLELRPSREGEPEAEILTQIWSQRAHALAEAPAVAATGETLDLLIFWLGHERYGIEVAHVREIYPLEQLTPVPHTPDFVAGIFSARGRILSVLDLRAFLGLTVGERSPQAKIMVVTNTNPISEVGYLELGILADEVVDVVTIFADEIEPSLTARSSIRADYIQGITADLLIVLNLNVLLNDKHLIVYEEIL